MFSHNTQYLTISIKFLFTNNHLYKLGGFVPACFAQYLLSSHFYHYQRKINYNRLQTERVYPKKVNYKEKVRC